MNPIASSIAVIGYLVLCYTIYQEIAVHLPDEGVLHRTIVSTPSWIVLGVAMFIPVRVRYWVHTGMNKFFSKKN